MKSTNLLVLLLLMTVAGLPACGGGGGGGGGGVPGNTADPNSPATIELTASKPVALANGSDAVVMQAAVKKADGTAVVDGTSVTFAAPAGSLSAPVAPCTSGNASITLTRSAVTGTTNQVVTVTAQVGGISATKDVKFINQPTSVDVTIAFDQTVTNLAALQFKLKNTAGAAFNNSDPQLLSAINSAAGSLILGNFSAVANTNTIALVSGAGFNTGTTPIIKATYSVSPSAGLPTFSVDSAGFTATEPRGNATTPQVTATNLVVSTVFNTE